MGAACSLPMPEMPALFVQRTCVVGTRPLPSSVGQLLAAERLLVHLSLALEATNGSAPRKVVPMTGPRSGSSLAGEALLRGG